MYTHLLFRQVRRFGPVLVIFFTLVFSGGPVLAQFIDNPNQDHIPGYLLSNSHGADNNTANSTVITINNWDNFNLGTDFAESNITADPSSPLHFFTAYNTNNGHHTENGLNWVSVTPNFGASMAGDPVVAYDSIGNLYYENLFGSISGVKVIKSTDNGATWGSSVTGTTGVDKCWLACDQTSGPYANNVYVCMTAGSGGNFAVSTDHGATFTTTFSPSTQTLPGMMVCVGAYNNIQGGAVYVVTNSGSGFASTYTFYRSLDGGATFTQKSSNNFSGYVGTNVNGRNSIENMRTRPYPMIAADNSYGPHRGRFYLAYASNDPPGDGNKPDIFTRYSDDGGTTWSSAVKANDDASTQNNNQWHPAIWCDKETGKLYVMFMDTRDTPTHDSAYIYATYSNDGGVTFQPNQRISNKKMKINCPSCGGGGAPAYQGDYNGIYSNKKGAMAGWTDFRNNTFMSTTAYFPDFAMALDHISDTLYTAYDSVTFNISIPEVKLYSDTVLLSGTISPTPTAGNLDVVFPSGNQITAFPGSRPGEIKLTGAVPPGLYTVNFSAAGPNGTPVHLRTATVRVLAGNAVYVNATATPGSICAGASSQLQATVLGGTLPYTYVWTPPTGLSSTTIANPVASPTVSTWYHVVVTDASSHSGSDSVLVTILPTPATPGTISGNTVACLDSISVYSIALVPNATSYSWTVPAGATILSGQNTTSIQVQWGSSGGNLSVIAGNSCGNSNPSVLQVAVVQPPSVPAAILGSSPVCINSTVIFYVDTVTGVSNYFWTVPTDATILSGQHTDTIHVHWGTASGDISVYAINACGQSTTKIRTIGIQTVPDPAGTISGNDSVCSNLETYTYSVPAITGAASYIWTTPSGINVISGTGNSIVVKINPAAQSGNISVMGYNVCGDGIASVKSIIVKTCTGVSEAEPLTGIKVYPNPAEDVLNIVIKDPEKQISLILVNIDGQTIFNRSLENSTPGMIHKIDISGFARGVYFVKLVNDQHFFVQRVVLK
jgi:hypothetical protein